MYFIITYVSNNIQTQRHSEFIQGHTLSMVISKNKKVLPLHSLSTGDNWQIKTYKTLHIKHCKGSCLDSTLHTHTQIKFPPQLHASAHQLRCTLHSWDVGRYLIKGNKFLVKWIHAYIDIYENHSFKIHVTFIVDCQIQINSPLSQTSVDHENGTNAR